MFKGDQFHQFIASSRSTIPQLSLSFPHPLHGSSNTNPSFPIFDPYSTASSSSSSHHHQHHQEVAFQANSFLHPFHQVPPPQPTKSCQHHEEGEEQKLLERRNNSNHNHLVGMNLEAIGRERIPADEAKDPWSSDEVLALLRIRSSLENWFPEFTWEHVSRKLADLGFKRSPEKCKEKFEEESRYFNNISNNNFNKSHTYRVFGELEELYNEGNGDNNNNHNNNQLGEEGVAENNDKIMDQPSNQEIIKQQEEEVVEEDKVGQDESRNHNHHQEVEDKAGGELDQEQDTNTIVSRDQVGKEAKGKRKRKRSSSSSSSLSSGKRFEMFKGFCEGVVKNLLAKQEEMHVKLLEDMVRRDEEKAAREEEWKRQEMDRIDKELALRAQEQVLASDRLATIMKFLNKFTQPASSTTSASPVEVPGGRKPPHDNNNNQVAISLINVTSSLILAQNPNNPTPQTPISPHDHHQLDAPNLPSGKPLQNPNLQNEPQTPSGVLKSASSSIDDGDVIDTGKRWPRDEVLALINLRCSLFINNDHHHQDKEPIGVGSSVLKGPLWERISKGMAEQGYRRSARRCKEKWENINKYFRKTKDLNKKRSVDSRTCPYFHQLNALYNQGKIISPTEVPKSAVDSP